jgi:flagellar biosynthesis component FlhA
MPATLPECETLRVELDSTIIELSNKLDLVRRRSAVEQVFADSEWYSRATAKLRYLRRDQQRLMRHVAELHKAERMEANSVDLVLLRELRKTLGEEAYQARCTQALAVLLGPT